MNKAKEIIIEFDAFRNECRQKIFKVFVDLFKQIKKKYPELVSIDVSVGKEYGWCSDPYFTITLDGEAKQFCSSDDEFPSKRIEKLADKIFGEWEALEMYNDTIFVRVNESFIISENGVE